MKEDKGLPNYPIWNLEESLAPVTIDDLVNSPPFRQASDDKGISITVGTRIPTWLHREIIKIKELPGSPYGILSDVLRDAVYIGLHVINIRYKLSPDWDVKRKMAAVIDSSSSLARLHSQINMLVDGLEGLIEHDDYLKAANQLTSYIEAVEELEDSWQKEKIIHIMGKDKVVKSVLVHCEPRIRKVVEDNRNNKDNNS